MPQSARLLSCLRYQPARLLIAALLALALPGRAQTLVRPGWTGAVNGEPWWRSAVFYRIAPEHFQDSDGDGKGDLRGISLRLDYLQALGVDAVVLQLPFDDAGFDDLLAETSRRHIRLVIGLDRSAAPLQGSQDSQAKPDQALAAVATHWLAQGAAGILLPRPAGLPAGLSETPDPAEQMRRDVSERLLLLALRRAAARMPGDRVIIPEAAALSATGTHALGPALAEPVNGPRSARAKSLDEPQLILTTLPLGESQTIAPGTVAAALSRATTGGAMPLLQLQPAEPGQAGATSFANAEIAAAALLTQRSAILLEYGQELGAAAPERMPWTPGNVTPPPALPPEAADAPKPPDPSVFGPYRPYVPPPPPKPRRVPPPGEADLPDPDTLPGFSTQEPADSASPAVPSPVPSAVQQERDPLSTLSLYRRLLALHRGNTTLRNGGLELVHTAAVAKGDQTVVWLRRAPSGMSAARSVVVAVNCGDQPADLSLASEFDGLGLHAFGLRSLLRGGQVMGSSRLVLAPHAVFVGELVDNR